MMNPLYKRYPRMLRHGMGRWLSIFLLLAVCIGLVSGFLLAASSIEKIFNEMPETYSIEDGHFECEDEASSAALDAVRDTGVTVYKNFNHDTTYIADDGAEVTLRVFENRTDINKAALYEGAFPQTNNEIAIDQTFAARRNITVGDALKLGEETYTVSGLMVLSDYSALFKNNSDFMMDTTTFCVGVTTPGGFDRLSNEPIHYTYSYVFDEPDLTTAQRTDHETEIAKALSDNDAKITDLIDAQENQAINYAGEDATHDQVIYEVLLALIIVIMAFIFVVLTTSTIEAESSVIGTLLASGYINAQLIRHYLFLPTIVGLVACVLGNVVGYIWLADPMKDLYYNSYSFPPYVAVFNLRVFVITTVIPFVLLVGISFWGIARKLRCTPLQFLRHDIARKSHRHGIVLPEKLGYTTRFRLRVFIRNLPHFATLFAGIAFSSLLLVFGLAILPVMQNYAGTLADTMPAQHLYMLKAPYELQMTSAQQEVRDQIAEMEELQEALSQLDEAGTALRDGSHTLQSALDQATAGGKQLADATSKDLGQGTQKLQDGSNMFEEQLAAQADAQRAQSDNLSLANEQQSYASALQQYVQACLVSSAQGGDPRNDPTALAAFASLQNSLETLLTKAAEKGGYAGAAAALEQAASGYQQLNDGVTALNASSGALGAGAVGLQNGLGRISDGYGTYANGVETYTDGVTQLLSAAEELVENGEATDDLAQRYHVVADEGTNSQAAIDAAEKIAVGKLDIKRTRSGDYETVTVYGIQENSRYWSGIDVVDGKIVSGAGLAKKCGAEAGGVSVFHNKYQDEYYALPISSTTQNETDTNVYMSIESFNELFDNEAEYFNGYVSDEPLVLDSEFLASHITPDDMCKIGSQMTDSMGKVIRFVVFLAVFVFFIVVYLLTRTTIEHSARSISYMKVFGYRNKEISKLYVRSITYTVIASLALTLPLVMWAVIQLSEMMLVNYAGNFVIQVPYTVLVADLIIGIVTYAVVAALHMRSIRKVPLALALKVTE